MFSLLSYVEALRAGALGQPYAVTRSLLGTDTGRDLERAGYFSEQHAPIGHEGESRFGLVRALTPDVTFVHALLGDSAGNVVVSAPSSEGFWAANGARSGVIVTVERLVSTAELRQFKDAMPIARQKVLAVCEAPGGAHPQPLYADPRFGTPGYEDDFEHYELWRRLATDDTLFARFERFVLDAEDGEAGYAAFKRAVSDGEFRAKRRATTLAVTEAPPPAVREGFDEHQESLFVCAARAICQKVKARGYRTIIAGIGGSFYAARLAKTWLAREQITVDVIVETGLIGVPCGAEGHDFLLSHRNMALSERLSDVADALGVLCAPHQRCLGVIGAAQVDESGAINSTLSPSGQFLVGSGGANDICASCAEVIVSVRCDRERLVERVAYVTSAGNRVTEVVTDLGTFSRESANAAWSLSSVVPLSSEQSAADAARKVLELCPWKCASGAPSARPLSVEERRDLAAIFRAPRTPSASSTKGTEA